jgi:DNA-binding CsgD family transcriptional regulator
MDRDADIGIPWKDINDYVYALGSARTKAELLERAVAELPKLVRYDNGGAVFDTQRRLVYGVGLPESAVARYHEHYQFLCLEDGAAAKNVFKFGEFFRDEFYFDFARPHGLEYGLSPCAPTGTVLVAANRSRSGPAFDEKDGRVIEILSGHLGNFYSIFERASAASPGSPSGDEIRFYFPLLSKREAEVAECLCRGFSAPEMASMLFLSVRTVETHVAHIYAKLGAASKRDAVSTILAARANRGGLTPRSSVCRPPRP